MELVQKYKDMYNYSEIKANTYINLIEKIDGGEQLSEILPAIIDNQLTEINDIHKKPLYDLSVFQNNHNQVDNIKTTLLKNQGYRCGKCMNYILANDASAAFMSYKVPLNQGGQNSSDNLMVTCYSCNSY